ncbi:hypothetical protein [Pseudomonas sp. Pc102]|nr:hypothetical protein [Pseudomonas sp. Pc102]
MKTLSILAALIILLAASFGAAALPKDQEQFTSRQLLAPVITQFV